MRKTFSAALITGLILAVSCSQSDEQARKPLDISNDHFVVGGPTSSGYWKIDIKSGYGIYSSGSFDAPLNQAFTASESGEKIVLDNTAARLILSPGSCENKFVTGDYSVRLELETRNLSGCGQRKTLPKIRTISASGNEPFWNFRITGDDAIYRSPEILEGIALSVTTTKDVAGTHYSGQLHGSIFTLTVTEQACEDDMSGFAFPMTVRLRKDGNTYNGCARLD